MTMDWYETYSFWHFKVDFDYFVFIKIIDISLSEQFKDLKITFLESLYTCVFSLFVFGFENVPFVFPLRDSYLPLLRIFCVRTPSI